MKARVRAPAKINLGLRITGRRPDGYHELDSVFVPLDLADDVVVELGGGPGDVCLELRGESRGIPADAGNLAARAAAAFLEASGIARGVRIELDKQIPAAAGLGGGSSDAAAVLRALGELLPGALPAERLAALAEQLGADVPFFLDPRPARVTGIGERLEPLADVPALALLLAHPGEALSTEEVYRAFDVLCPQLAPASPAPPTGLGSGGADPAALEAALANDLEPAARRLCPPIARLRARLRDAGARAVGMSGSGPTLYGVFGTAAEAAAALDRARFEPPVWARLATTVESR